MARVLKHLIPLGRFAPDANEFDADYVESIVNLLPVFSSHRPANQVERVNVGQTTNIADSKISGAYMHLTTEVYGLYSMVPDVDVTAWETFRVTPENIESYYEALKGAVPNDGSYVVFPADGTNQILKISLTPVPTNVKITNPTLDSRVRFRVRGEDETTPGTYSITVKVYRNNFGELLQTFSDTGNVGTDAAEWENISLSSAESTLVSTDVLGVEITVNATAAAAKDVENAVNNQVDVENWNKSDSEKWEWQLISTDDDDATGSVNELEESYIETRGLADTMTQEARFKIHGVSKFAPTHGNELHVTHEVLADDMDLDVTIYDMSEFDDDENDDPQEIEIFTTTIVDPKVVDGIAKRTISIPEATAETIVDHRKLEVLFTYHGVAGGASQEMWATHKDYNVGWEKENDTGIGGDLTGRIQDNSYYMRAQSGEGNATSSYAIYTAQFQDSGVDPQDATGTYRLRIEARTLTNDGKMAAFIDGKSLGTATVTTTTWNWYNFGLTYDGANNSPTDWDDFLVAIKKQDNGGGDNYDLEVRRVKVETPGANNRGRIMDFRYVHPDYCYVDVSWVHSQVDTETGDDYYGGDQPKLYVGSNAELMEGVLPEYNLSVVTRSTGGGTYTDDKASGWRFCSFGSRVIATNYIDAIQVKDSTDTIFSDMITVAGDVVDVRGRHCATIAGQLCMGNINPEPATVSAYANSYTFWCSKLGDPTEFNVADTGNQSTYFQLVAKTGAITGMVGGEYGIVFKENAIYRANYVGLPVIWDFDQITNEQGTPYTRSIVSADNDVYFWGNGGIFAITNHGREIRRIGQGVIEKYLFDTRFQDTAIRPAITDDIRHNWGAVFGAYDPYSGLIIWSYRLQGDAYGENSGILVYSRKEDRFAILNGNPDRIPIEMTDTYFQILWNDLQTWKFEELVTRGNVVSNEEHILRGIFAISSGILQPGPPPGPLR